MLLIKEMASAERAEAELLYIKKLKSIIDIH